VRGHPDRLAAFASLHPGAGREATLNEVRRARDEGLIGLGELSPHSQGHGIDDPVFRAALELAAELRLPVNFHVTDPASKDYPGRVETPLADFARLAREFPRTTFILSHLGGLLPLVDLSAVSWPNLFYDTAAVPLIYPPEILRRMLDVVGKEKVLFGSDYPLILFPREETGPGFARFLAQVSESKLNAAERAALLGGNLEHLLRSLP
jgi:uncharacterized protein